MVRAVAAIDVLDHLLAAVGLEIDIDVRRERAFCGEKAFEHQVVAQGVDRVKCPAGRRRASWRRSRGPGSGCRLLRKADDVVDDQEIVAQAAAFDHGQLVRQLTAHGSGVAP